MIKETKARVGGKAEHYFVMLKPASSLCNLRCKYCFYADVSRQRDIGSYGMMTEERARGIIGNIFEGLADGSTVSIGFQGGEPTLRGLDFYRQFVSTVNEMKGAVRVDYSLQTNGILLDEKWCDFLSENHFLVGLSIDADAEPHNENRVDQAGSGSFSRVLAAKRLLDAHKVEYNILTVLTGRLARHPKRVWKFLCDQGIKYVQFIPCLSELESNISSPYALSPERFAAFYSVLFGLWADSLRVGKYISIKLFDDLFNLLLRRQVTSCGFTGDCQCQIVVEADGSVYPCDFYAVDRWRLGSLTETPMTTLIASDAAREFIEREKPRHGTCRNCRWWGICGGGCARMDSAMYVDRNERYCGYREFLTQNTEGINRVAAELSRGMR